MDLPNLAALTTAQLASLIEQAQAAWPAAEQREQAQAAEQRALLDAVAATLRGHLGPEQPDAGSLASLRAAALLTSDDLGQRPADALRLVILALRDVTEAALQAVRIGQANI